MGYDGGMSSALDTATVAPSHAGPSQAAQPPALPPHYNLLTSVSVPNATVRPKGLVLVVGPNSSGKTQFLKDVHHLLTGQPRDLVVCSGYRLSKPPKLDTFLEHLIREGYVKRERDQNGSDIVRQTAPHLGGGDFRGHNTAFGNVQNWFNTFAAASPPTGRIEKVHFLELFGHCLTTALFLENRLRLANQVNQFDYEANPPNNDLQALYLSETARRRLSEEVRSVFGKGVWLDFTRGSMLCLRVSQSPAIPPAEERLQPERMRKFRLIESEGDGLRSYVGICIALLLGRRPVCLIDEPELCLHPPQAYAMGRLVGTHGTSPDHATFVSTHSSHLLRGIIEATRDVQILRLSKVGERFSGHLIGYDILKECIKRPIVRAETILDGIFADGVTLVESDGDRAVYQAAWESLMHDLGRRDILFIPVGGTGGFADIARFYHTLKIPVAAIADLDLIMDPDKLERILDVNCDRATAREIIAKCREVAQHVRQLPPSISEGEVQGRLRELGEAPLDWTAGDDVRVRHQLNGLARQIDRMRRLKGGGVEALRACQPVYEGLKAIVEKCRAAAGVLLVPVGELEHWEPEMMVGLNKERKAEWANDAAMRIREEPAKLGELREFMRSMAEYHAAESVRLAGG